MKLRSSPIFLFAFLLCPAFEAAAANVFQPCEAKEPSEWQTRVDKEPAAGESAETGAVEVERVAPADARAPFAVPTPITRLAGDAPFRQAYEDVYSILSAENECSRFYGGAAPAAHVFNQLAAQFRPARIGGSRTAGKMDGATTSVMHAPSGLRFRLFERAVLNTEGAFYRRHGGAGNGNVPRVGGFPPDTRGARALILLHELGHVVKGRAGRWLLEDDGGEPSLSERNTGLVEEHCGAQLRALGAATQPPAEVARSPARERDGRDTQEQ